MRFGKKRWGDKESRGRQGDKGTRRQGEI